MYTAHRSFALGASVPTEHGTFTATTIPPYCGSPFALQQMLSDLGFYSGPVNGQVDEPTKLAASAFARANGVTNLSAVTAEFCRMLGSEWEKLKAPAAATLRPLLPRRVAAPSATSTDLEPVYETPALAPPATGWAGLDVTTKYAIGAAVALGLGGVIVLVVVGKKRKKK